MLNYSGLPDKLPDAYIAVKGDKNTRRYFFEIIDQYTPRFVIRSKIQQHLEYFDSQVWQESSKRPFLKILILCPNETIKKYLYSYIARIMEEEDRGEPEIYLSTEPKTKWSNAIQLMEDN